MFIYEIKLVKGVQIACGRGEGGVADDVRIGFNAIRVVKWK